VRNSVLGTVRGTGEVFDGALVGASRIGVNALQAVSVAAAAAVRGAARAGTDTALAARSAVEGAIWGAQDLGVDPIDVAIAAEAGAIRAAAELGSAALRAVRPAVSGVIGGVPIPPEASAP